MYANNKEDFLFQLHNELHRIGVDANEDIFSDFEEHFKMSAEEGFTEEETCQRLGDVKEIARSYIDIESSRINSIVAHAIEEDRPHVSLTKPGRNVPADLSLVKDKSTVQEQAASQAPLPEYTPQHLSEEIYPNAASRPLPEYTPEHHSAEIPGNAAQSTAEQASQSSTAENGGKTGQDNQSLSDAFGAAGKAIGEAAKAAGHAVAEAFSQDNVKNAGRNAAEAVKHTGGIVADKVKNAAGNAKSSHQSKQNADAVPHPTDDIRANNTDSRQGEIPPQCCDKVGSGKSYTFKDIKNMQMNPNAGKLIGCVCMDVFLWWWLICGLAAIAIEICLGGLNVLIPHGIRAIFVGLGSYHIISRIFYGIGMISLGVIILLLGILLIKGIIKLIKHIVMLHVKALYDL